MADSNLARSILELYPEITIDDSRSNDKVVTFSLMEKKFALLCPDEQNPASAAFILVIDDDFEYPHIMLRDIDLNGDDVLPKGKYRYVCLHQSGSVISFLQSLDEKVTDEIERLIELMKLSQKEVEREYQKEFLYYWNSVSHNDNAQLFLRNTDEYVRMGVYQGEKIRRYLAPDIVLSDIDERKSKSKDRAWQRRSDIEAFFIPIIDNRGILPPTKKKKWGVSEIIEILYGKRIRHISCSTFDAIKNETTHYNCIDLIFSMVVNALPITFMARLTIKNSAGNKTLLARILEGNFEVQTMSIQREDYAYLNDIIGNSSSCSNKRVLLIGAGSLGSYVAWELVKNGFKQLTIYDGDRLSSENFMRWAYGGILKSGNKATTLKFYLELMHPEIVVDSHEKNFYAQDITDQINDYDYIIFTVGSSDIQLQLNRILKEKNIKSRVLFAWLEAGGEHSHILSIDYHQQGCFECLFTDGKGDLINNKVNVVEEDIVISNTISNGCGATRVAYGSAVILRTVSTLLTFIKEIESGAKEENCLINIAPDKVVYDFDTFEEKRCRCCGDKTQ